jgi:hypothetical protein
MVEDVMMDKSLQSNSSRKYLEEKLLIKLKRKEIWFRTFKLKHKVEELLEAAQVAVEKLWSCEEVKTKERS